MKNNRRKFIKQLAGTGLMASSTSQLFASGKEHEKIELHRTLHEIERKRYSANDTIRLAAIGTGIIGHYNIDAALGVPGIELVAACDLYDGRLKRVKEKYGDHVDTTRDYKEILEREDVDAVLIATSDHWHDRMAKDAMNAGKAIYCEKPMVHKIEEGQSVIDTEKKTKAIFQVGSTGVSSILMAKAKEIYEAGDIGELVAVEAAYDRHSAIGAWQYSIPPDASADTIDWERFLGDAPKTAFDPIRFFRWRNYQDYGTGIAGDLYVHLFSWLHFIISSNGPNRIYASGGLKYWKDGRDVPDLMTSVVDYPETNTHANFQMQIRVNFVAGGEQASGLKLVGTEGSIKYAGDRIIVQRTPFSNEPGYGGYDSLLTFTEDMQEQYIEQYKAKYYKAQPNVDAPVVEFVVPENYSDRHDHWVNLVAAIREGNTVFQDATYGLRAAAPSLAANISYFDKKIVKWDPERLKLS